jgi:hypothetical protein
VVKVWLHSTGDASPLAALLLTQNTPGILGRRALPAGRLARLGATPDLHHGLLAGDNVRDESDRFSLTASQHAACQSHDGSRDAVICLSFAIWAVEIKTSLRFDQTKFRTMGFWRRSLSESSSARS